MGRSIWSRCDVCIALTAVLVAARTLVVRVNSTTASLAMLLLVLGIATRWGLREAVFTSVVCVFAFNFYFLPPLMRQDASFCMPPCSVWLQGPDEIRTWMLGLGCGCRRSRLVGTFASGWPAFAQYRRSPGDGGHKACALIVLELSGDQICG